MGGAARRKEEVAAQEPGRERRAQIEPARQGLDGAAIGADTSRARPRVGGLGSDLEVGAVMGRDALDLAETHHLHQFLEVAAQHRLLFRHRAPEERRADAAQGHRDVARAFDRDEQHPAELAADQRSLPTQSRVAYEGHGRDIGRFPRQAVMTDRDALELDPEMREIRLRLRARGGAERALQRLARPAFGAPEIQGGALAQMAGQIRKRPAREPPGA